MHILDDSSRLSLIFRFYICIHYLFYMLYVCLSTSLLSVIRIDWQILILSENLMDTKLSEYIFVRPLSYWAIDLR